MWLNQGSQPQREHRQASSFHDCINSSNGAELSEWKFYWNHLLQEERKTREIKTFNWYQHHHLGVHTVLFSRCWSDEILFYFGRFAARYLAKKISFLVDVSVQRSGDTSGLLLLFIRRVNTKISTFLTQPLFLVRKNKFDFICSWTKALRR